MFTKEPFIHKNSDYYNYQPSLIGSKTFFYPIVLGHFFYEAGYQLSRNSFDSFLLLYVVSGSMFFTIDNKETKVSTDQFVLIDCYKPHSYRTEKECECLWIHFDGPVARPYYEQIHSQLGNFFQVKESLLIVQNLQLLYDHFRGNQILREPALSKQISDILTALFLADTKEKGEERANVIDPVLTRIAEHFGDNITVESLADSCSLSPYYFIRLFKKQTGFTPYEYIINTRLQAAKYLLNSSNQTIKEICYQVGFSSESVFCSAFKKKVGLTPTQYRNQTRSDCYCSIPD